MTVTTQIKAAGASKELARQQGKASAEDLELAAEGVAVDSFLVDVAKRHGMKTNFAEAITEGYIERSIEGASHISVTVHDGTREILRSGMFGTEDNQKLPAIDVKVEGLWFRLASFQKSGLDITLEFEDRWVFFMKSLTLPISASRAHTTRAEFIGRMVRAVKAGGGLRYFCPELHTKQPIEGEGGVEGYTEDKKTGKRKYKSKKKSERQRRAELAGGLLSTTDLKIKGVEANNTQLQILEEILDAGSEMGANKKVLLSSIMCVIDESDVSILTDPVNGEGPFSQIPADGWPGGHDVKADARAYFKKAIENDKNEPQYTLTLLVHSVQGNKDPQTYAPFRAEAEAILKEYGEKGIAAKHGRTIVREFDFHVGPPNGKTGENYWEASESLAKEVNWRRFIVGNTFYYVKDTDLITRKPVAEFDEDTEGIEEINGVIDAGLPVSECVVKCRATRWWAPPGSVIKLKNMGPFSGRWLVFTIHRDLFSEETEVRLYQPEATKPERANQSVTVASSGSGEALVLGSHVSGGSPRERIVEAAKWALAHKANFIYKEVRPYPASLFGKGPIITDCSGFATLCYKAAGVKDPNGAGYNGQGFTGTLQAHGNKSNTPEPGDLVFYYPGAGAGGSAGHVGVYIGEGKVIDFGHPGGPEENPIHLGPIVEVRNYSLEEEPGLSPKPSGRNAPPTPVGQLGPTPENNLRAGLEEQNALNGL